MTQPDSPERTERLRTVGNWFNEYRRPFVVLIHLGIIALSSYAAIWLRFDGDVPDRNWQVWLRALPWLVLLRALTFGWFRLYQGLWKYTGIWDLRNILTAVVLSTAAHYLLIHWVFHWTDYPRAVFIIDAVLLLPLMGGVRMVRRMVTELQHTSDGRRVLVYGAGDEGEAIVRDMRNMPNQPYWPIGFIDDDHSKVGLRIHGVPVLGTRQDLSAILKRHKPHEVLIGTPGAEPAAIRAIVRALEPFKIPIKTLPNLRDLIDGKVELAKIRNLSVEDLLTRVPVGLDIRPVKSLIAGRRVMVTGAGGSIGSELCRQIASLKPATLVLLDRYENSLHDIRIELDDRKYGIGIVPVIADVTDAARIDAVLAEHQPAIVFHAAAHKHVPLMEENPCEAVKNNVGGTRVLAQAADRHGVARFTMISSDKAANPTSIMGASKRMAELVVQAQARGSGTSFSIVRFGNVLASNGSVVPRFLDQIRRGGPVTVAHPEMRRFFMLISEAVQLVLHVASQAESGATYVLEMGEQVKLLDLARNLIRLSGFVPDDDIKIEFTGVRPGEKMYEELVGADEEARPSTVQDILFVRTKQPPDPQLFEKVEALEREARAGHTDRVLEMTRALVGTFGRVEGAPPVAAKPPEIEVVRSADVRRRWEQPCPRCHVGLVHRSHARTIPERLRKPLTRRRLFGCSACGWRGWLVPEHVEGRPSMDPSPPRDPDLASVDAVIKPQPAARRHAFSPRDLQ